MSAPATWSQKEHEQTDVTVVLPVSEALHLQALLPRLLAALAAQGARGPEDRERQRQAQATVETVLDCLGEALRPYDVPTERIP